MTGVASKSEMSLSRSIALGAMVYASLFVALTLYSWSKTGVSAWWWIIAEVLIATAIGAFGFWQLTRSAPLFQTVLLVAFLHFAIRIGPIFVMSWGDEHNPPYARPLIFIGSLVVMSGWFLVSRLVVQNVQSRSVHVR